MRLIENATLEKLRGGFYTPAPIAEFILRWAINGNKDFDILEPSCGDGVFLKALKQNNFQFKSITAIEYNPDEAKKAEQIFLHDTSLINIDFHKYCNETSSRFDLIVGNPPYIRYQYFESQQQIEAEKIFKRAGLKYTKLTNAWVSFIVGSSLLLRESGKIGFVLPAEILQVSYAKQLREFLAHFYNKINIISFEKLVFPDIQQEVVLLLCEKDNSNIHMIEQLELRDASYLQSLDVNKLKSPTKQIDFETNKWTYYFLEQKEIDFLEELNHSLTLPKLNNFAEVEVGITTGSNEFFSVPFSLIQKYELSQFAKPLVGRSVQVNSLIFTKRDWEINKKSEARAYLLIFPLMEQLKEHPGAITYLKQGEKLGINKGYKTRIRDEWQIVPSIWVSECLFIRRNNIYPKLILNKAKAYTTDTMHRVKLKKGVKIEALTASYYNSLSFAFAEILGRSYGGGVLELMPSEAEKIVLPYSELNSNLLPVIDDMLRKKIPVNKILSHTNDVILKQGYGFSNTDIRLADNIWEKLSNRRLNRSK